MNQEIVLHRLMSQPGPLLPSTPRTPPETEDDEELTGDHEQSTQDHRLSDSPSMTAAVDGSVNGQNTRKRKLIPPTVESLTKKLEKLAEKYARADRLLTTLTQKKKAREQEYRRRIAELKSRKHKRRSPGTKTSKADSPWVAALRQASSELNLPYTIFKKNSAGYIRAWEIKQSMPPQPTGTSAFQLPRSEQQPQFPQSTM